MSRKTARKYAFELVFQIPFHQDLNLDKAYNNSYEKFKDLSDSDKNFIYTEFKGVSQNTDLIDGYIKRNLKKWKIDRIEKELLAIIRIATYEMIFDDETPISISINEAVELSKEYSDEKGRKFSNGLLSSIAKEITQNPKEQTLIED